MRGSYDNNILLRIFIEGHAIETSWFLLEVAADRNDDALRRRAIEDFMIKPFQLGWDKEHGGLFSFLDAGNVNVFAIIGLDGIRPN